MKLGELASGTPGAVLSGDAMRRIVARCEKTGATLVADEVYLGAEIYGERTRSFWGMSGRVIVTSERRALVR